MNKRLVSISMLLMLLISIFSIIMPIMPTGASPEPADLHVVPFTLNQTGSATAQWTTADKHTGSYSVRLTTTTTTGDFAGVAFAPTAGLGGYNGTIDSITSLSFWYKHISYSNWAGPRMALVMINESQNYMAVTGCAVHSTVWKNADAVNGVKDTDWYTTGTGNQIWWYGTWDGENLTSYSQVGGPITFDAIKTSLTGADVLGVVVYMGVVGAFVGAGSAYIDDPEVNGITYYGKIQDAIDVASPGDTIIVHDGTYSEALYINKSLTIRAASTPVIQGSQLFATDFGNREAVVFVENAVNVVLEDLDVEGLGLGPVKSYGILYENSSGTVHECVVSPNTIGDMNSAGTAGWSGSNLTIENCEFKNFGRIGIYSNAANLVIRNNTIIGQVYSQDNLVNYGIEIEDYSGASTAEIVENEIYNSDNTHPSPLWSSAAIIVDIWRMYYDLPPSTVSIERNDIHDNYEAIQIVSSPLSYAHYNNIYNNRYGVYVDPDLYGNNATFDSRFNWWGDASGPTHSSNTGGTGNSIGDYVDYSPWLGATFETTPRTYHVNPSGAPGAIQEAIDEASPGDTVIIHDGTYDEQVVINKSLTVQGTGSTPVIKPSSAANLTTILSGRYWGGTKQIAGIIVVNVADGSSVTLKNLIVDGENILTKPTLADYVTGIFYRETGGLIDTVTIANMTIDATGTAVRAYGIYLSAIVNTVSVEIKDCNITNYDKNGINAHGDKLTVNIHDNTITGRGPLPSGDEVQNGIVIMDSAIATVNSNTISDLAYIPETWWSAGILFLDGGNGCSANYNTINDCQIGIIFNDMSGSATGNTVNGETEGKAGIVLQQSWGTGTWTASFVNNTVNGCDTEGIGVHSYDADTSLTATIDSNNLNGGLGTGILIGDIPDYSPAGNITITITNNNISNWHHGIHLASSVIDATITGNTITDFEKGGIVTRAAKNILIEGNTISTTLHDLAPNGIDIGTYSGTTGTIRGNTISGCSWNGFTGDYDTSWSGSGILVIESGDSLEILGNTVHHCDVGLDIESDSMNMTCNEVYDNIYGFVFWNARPKVNYNNIYNNTQYGVYRTALGDLTDVLDARYNWWGNASGPAHPSNPSGTGDAISGNVSFSPWLLQVKVPPLIHDIAIISVVPDVAHQYPGRMVNITVVVKNNGNMYETFNVTAYRNSTAIGTILVTDLGIGENTTIIFQWNTSGLTPCQNWTIRAEAPLIGDVNPGDNNVTDGTVKIAMLGDVNCDSVVDIDDVLLIIAAFASYPTRPSWNPQADLDGDNLVDIVDVIMVLANFGKSCP